MKNHYYLTKNGNILVVSENEESDESFFMSPNGNFLRLVTKSEAKKLATQATEVSFPNGTPQPKHAHQWKHLWSVRDIEERAEVAVCHFYALKMGITVRYSLLREIVSPFIQDSERDIFLLDQKRFIRTDAEWKHHEAVLDQIATRCDFKRVFEAVDMEDGEDMELLASTKLARIKIMKELGINPIVEKYPKLKNTARKR